METRVADGETEKIEMISNACHNLAEQFLPNGPADSIDSLAEQIQTAVETWFDRDREEELNKQWWQHQNADDEWTSQNNQ